MNDIDHINALWILTFNSLVLTFAFKHQFTWHVLTLLCRPSLPFSYLSGLDMCGNVGPGFPKVLFQTSISYLVLFWTSISYSGY